MFTLLLIALTVSAFDSAEFKSWAAKYKKTFANRAEYLYRLAVYLDNKKLVEEAAQRGEKLELNVFADMTHEEFIKTHLGMTYKAPESQPIKYKAMKSAPESLDYRSNLGAAKDQGQCGSCWSFCTVAVMEARISIEKGQKLQFSEQNIVDCDTSDNGCEGGHPSNAFPWIASYGGIASESGYPYTSGTSGQAGGCKAAQKVVTSSSNIIRITDGDESELTQILADHGPVAIGMYASLASFQLYQAGTIYAPTNCRPRMMNHCVTLVGYGKQGATPYWLIRNSWGTSWGDQGYFMMARNSNNMCGVGLDTTYPNSVSLL